MMSLVHGPKRNQSLVECMSVRKRMMSFTHCAHFFCIPRDLNLMLTLKRFVSKLLTLTDQLKLSHVGAKLSLKLLLCAD